MKRTNLLTSAAARLLLPAAASLFFAAAPAVAQTTNARTNAQQQSSQQPSQSSQTAAAQADEDFELNIDTRRIDENDFHAETAVEADGARGLSLRVGVALSASDIEVLLRNVRGRVRFRASLAPVLRLLDARRPTTPPAAAAPTPP